MWSCQTASSQSRSCREGIRESWTISGWNRTYKAASGKNRVQETKPLWTRIKVNISLDIRLSDGSRAWESETRTGTKMKRGLPLCISHRSSSVLRKCILRVLVNLTQPALQKVEIIGCFLPWFEWRDHDMRFYWASVLVRKRSFLRQCKRQWVSLNITWIEISPCDTYFWGDLSWFWDDVV